MVFWVLGYDARILCCHSKLAFIAMHECIRSLIDPVLKNPCVVSRLDVDLQRDVVYWVQHVIMLAKCQLAHYVLHSLLGIYGMKQVCFVFTRNWSLSRCTSSFLNFDQLFISFYENFLYS